MVCVCVQVYVSSHDFARPSALHRRAAACVRNEVFHGSIHRGTRLGGHVHIEFNFSRIAQYLE